MANDGFLKEADELRATLYANGWPAEWREENEFQADRREHGVELFSSGHERGPLVRWLHPTAPRCECEA